MAKSKLIKQIISDEISLDEAFDRLLAIAMELDDATLIKWAKQEKLGYADDDELPPYRIIQLTPMGTYHMYAAGGLMTHKNHVLPTLGVPKELKESFEKKPCIESISSLLLMIERMKKGERMGIPVPPELYHYFTQGTNIQVTNASLMFDLNEVSNIVSSTKTRLIEVLILLEKNFGILDDVDIDMRDYDVDELASLRNAVEQILQGQTPTTTYYITDSKIKKSNIGNGNSQDKNTSFEVSPTVKVEQGEKKKEGFLKRIIRRIFTYGKA